MKRLIVFILAGILLFAACAPAAKRTPVAMAIPAAAPTQAAAMALPGKSYPAAPAATPAPGQEKPVNPTSPLAYSPSGSQMVIKDAQLDLLVQDTAQALARVTGLVSDEGGYIISSQTWYQDGYLHASLRIGIPSARFEAALNQLRLAGLSVLRENAQGQDVSDQYVDLQSRLTNLQATADRVRDFLKSAKTIEDSLRINQQLSDLEGQIEQVKGQMRYFEGRSAFSTVTVSLTPQYPTPTPTVTPTMLPTATATPPWNPGKTFNSATNVLSRNLQGFTDAAIWLGVVFLPWALLILAVSLIGRALWKRAAHKAK